MSWGHAVSDDLVTWDERPVAIRQSVDADGQPVEYVFSGSAVHDGDDLVAVYTSVRFPTGPDAPGLQTQHLARSTDGGETWVKDPANPVLDRGSDGLPRPEGVPRRRPLGDGRRRGDRAAGRRSTRATTCARGRCSASSPTRRCRRAPGSARTSSRWRSRAPARSGGCCWSACWTAPRAAAAACAGGSATSTARTFTPEARRLAGPRPRLLRRRHLQRRPRRPAGDDRLAGQLGLRAPDPHRRLARRDDAPARPDPGGHRRRAAAAPDRGAASWRRTSTSTSCCGRARSARSTVARCASRTTAPPASWSSSGSRRRSARRSRRCRGCAVPLVGRDGRSRGVAGPVLGRGVRRRRARGADLPGVPRARLNRRDAAHVPVE